MFGIILRKEIAMSISSEFTCKCKKQKGWITEEKETKPCPDCGRTYMGRYSQKRLGIDAIEIRSWPWSILTSLGIR